MEVTPDDLMQQRRPMAEHAAVRNRWPAPRSHAFKVLQPCALALVATEGPVSFTLWSRGEIVKRLGHNRGVWPAKLARTSQWKDAVSATYDKSPFCELRTQFRVWCLTEQDRDALATKALSLLEARADNEGGIDELRNGFLDMGPDIDLAFLELEVRGLTESLGVPKWDDDELEHFLDRVSARVGRLRQAGKGFRDERKAYDAAALEELKQLGAVK